jgi:hypothetical protein
LRQCEGVHDSQLWIAQEVILSQVVSCAASYY